MHFLRRSARDPSPDRFRLSTSFTLIQLAVGLGALSTSAPAPAQTTSDTSTATKTLAPVSVTARPEGLDEAPPAYAGGQVGSGARLGILGNTSVMDTPFSITSYTLQTIENEQARSMADVLAFDPSVRMASARSNINEDFTIRGFPVSSQDFSLNGMYGLTPFWRAPLEMAERVEVLKGPSAMLNGMAPSGNIGGAINIVPKRAGAQPLTRLTGSYLGDSIFGGHLDLGRRFGPADALGVRLNVMHRQGDTVIKRQSTRESLASVGLDYRTGGFRASADLLWQEQRIDGLVRQLSPSPTLTAVPRVPDNSLGYPGFGYTDGRDGSALIKAEYDFSEWVTGFVGYGHRQNKWDAIAANPTLLNTAGDYAYFGGWQRMNVTSKSLEAGLRSAFKTGPIAHKATLAYTRVDQDQTLGFYTGFASGASNLYSPVQVETPSTAGISNPLQRYLSTTLTSLALSDTMSVLSDRVLLTVGARNQRIEGQNYNFVTGAPSGPQYNDSVTTPLAGVVFKLQPNLSLYASHIQGLSRGDTAPIVAGLANPGQMLAPYKSKQNEVGVKFDAGRITTTVALFELKKPGASVSNNVFSVNGEQRNRGVELNVFGEAARGFRLLGGVTYTQGTLTESPDPTLRGRDAIGVPRLLANLGAEWDAGFLPGLTLTGRVLHTGKSYLNSTNTLEVPSWNRFDAGARYRLNVSGKPVVVRLNVENLTNKNYYGVATAGYLHVGTPRTISLSASVDL